MTNWPQQQHLSVDTIEEKKKKNRVAYKLEQMFACNQMDCYICGLGIRSDTTQKKTSKVYSLFPAWHNFKLFAFPSYYNLYVRLDIHFVDLFGILSAIYYAY